MVRWRRNRNFIPNGVLDLSVFSPITRSIRQRCLRAIRGSAYEHCFFLPIFFGFCKVNNPYYDPTHPTKYSKKSSIINKTKPFLNNLFPTSNTILINYSNKF